MSKRIRDSMARIKAEGKLNGRSYGQEQAARFEVEQDREAGLRRCLGCGRRFRPEDGQVYHDAECRERAIRKAGTKLEELIGGSSDE